MGRPTTDVPPRGQRLGALPRGGWETQAWSTVLRVGVFRALLAMLATLLLWAVVPVVLGWTPRVIVSGSMEPAIGVGDVVVTRPVDPGTLTDGAVVTTAHPDHPGRTRTHRFVARDAAGLVVTKGDANADRDSTPVPDAEVLGRGGLRVPYVGLPTVWAGAGDVRDLGLVAGGTALLVLGSWGPGRRPRRTPPRHALAGPRPALGRRVAVVALVTAGAMAVGATVGDVTAAGFVSRTSSPTSGFRAGPLFYPYRDVVRADAPTYYWRLDEVAGTAVADSSGRGNNAAARGAVTWRAAGALASEPQSTSVALGGGWIAAGQAVSASTTFSLEAWVRTTTTRGGNVVSLGNAADLLAPGSERALYLLDDGTVRFGVYGYGGLLNLVTSTVTVRSTSRVNDGAWHHLVGTFSPSGSLRLYVDGVQQAELAATVTPFSRTGWYYRAGADALSGWPDSPTSSTLDARLDEVAIYDGTVLSGTRVAEHHRVGRAGWAQQTNRQA